MSDEDEKEHDKIIRDMIQHEDKLISDRIGWSLASQSFLFTALRFANQSNTDDQLYAITKSLNVLIPWIGFFISVLTLWGVLRAFEARLNLIHWHKDKVTIVCPPLMGRELKIESIFIDTFRSPNFALPILMIAFWFLVSGDGNHGWYFLILFIFGLYPTISIRKKAIAISKLANTN